MGFPLMKYVSGLFKDVSGSMVISIPSSVEDRLRGAGKDPVEVIRRALASYVALYTSVKEGGTVIFRPSNGSEQDVTNFFKDENDG